MTETILKLVAELTNNNAEEVLSATNLKTGDNFNESEVLKIIKKMMVDKITTHGNNQQQRGFKEGREVAENFFTDLGFDNKDNLKGKDFLKKALDYHKNKVISEKGIDPKKLEGLTADQIKSLPIYAQLKKSDLQEANKKFAELETKHNNYVNQIKEGQRVETLKVLIAKQMDADKYQLKTENFTREQRLNSVFRQTEFDRLKIVGEGDAMKAIPIDENGDQQTDSVGNPRTLSHFLGDYVTFEKNVIDPKGDGGIKSGNVSELSKIGITIQEGEQLPTFSSREEYESALASSTPKDRLSIQKGWLAQQAAKEQ